MDVENFLGSIEEKTEFMYFRNYCIEEKNLAIVSFFIVICKQWRFLLLKIENYTGQIERIMIKYN